MITRQFEERRFADLALQVSERRASMLKGKETLRKAQLNFNLVYWGSVCYIIMLVGYVIGR